MKNDVAKSMSIRAKINNFAKANGISPQHAMQSYFAERFLARIEKSKYVKNLAIKGGALMSDILGIAKRTTMDVDATIIGMHVDEEAIKRSVAEVAATDVEDGIVFEVNLSEPGAITKDDDYGGYSIGMHALLGTIRLPICIDLTFGDIITPKAERRCFSTMLDDKAKITVLAYTVETIIAEKLQTVLKRGAANTRPRDYYDLYMLSQLGGYEIDTLKAAVTNTFSNRHSEEYLKDWRKIVSAVADSEAMLAQWKRYQSNAPYTDGIAFADVINAVEHFFEEIINSSTTDPKTSLSSP